METPPADTSVKIGKGRILLTIQDENWDVYVVDAADMKPVNLTNGEEYDADPKWSPDGEQIVFESSQGNDDIYVMNTDGTQITNITQDKAYDSNPDWSPIEEKIIFVSRPHNDDVPFAESHDDVYIMNADGSDKTNLTENPTNNDTEPVWSPDGRQIAFVSDRDGNREIYVMNADGLDAIRLTNDEASDKGPVWSPDGVWILFTSNRFFNDDVFATLVDGTAGAIRLTDSEKGELVSDWIE